MNLADEKQKPVDFLFLLIEKQLYRDAFRFVVHLMTTRQAVWWGCLCVWAVTRPSPGVKESDALQAALRWVLDPSEANRRAAEAPGRTAGAGTSAGALAMAAFWSGGSMSPPDLPAVPPPAGLSARTVAAAILLAARADPAQTTRRCQVFVGFINDLLVAKEFDKVTKDKPKVTKREFWELSSGDWE